MLKHLKADSISSKLRTHGKINCHQKRLKLDFYRSEISSKIFIGAFQENNQINNSVNTVETSKFMKN
jgi:hypothetical protein